MIGSHRIRSRPINPNLYENARKEFDRLKKYMYKDSTSPWASPLVIAPKATTPFIRFCGDYRWLNQLVILPQAYIPHVQHEIEKAMGFRVFLDIGVLCSSKVRKRSIVHDRSILIVKAGFQACYVSSKLLHSTTSFTRWTSTAIISITSACR